MPHREPKVPHRGTKVPHRELGRREIQNPSPKTERIGDPPKMGHAAPVHVQPYGGQGCGAGVRGCPIGGLKGPIGSLKGPIGGLKCP